MAYPGIFPPFSNPEISGFFPNEFHAFALLDRPRRLEGGRRLTSIGTAVGGLLDTKGVPKDLPQPQPVLSEDDTLIGHQPATIQGVMGHDPQMRQLQGGKTWVSGSRRKKGAPWKKWCKYANKSGIHDKNGKTINRISIWAVDCCKTPLSHCQTIQKCKWDHIHQPGHWAGPMGVTTIVQGDERIFPQTVSLELRWIATFVYRRSEAKPSIGCPSCFIKPWRKSSLAGSKIQRNPSVTGGMPRMQKRKSTQLAPTSSHHGWPDPQGQRRYFAMRKALGSPSLENPQTLRRNDVQQRFWIFL